MSGLRLTFLAIATSSIAASPSLAAAESSSYVYCHNGIACFMQPCPSGDVLDLVTGKVVEGVELNTTPLPLQDRASPDVSEKLVTGKIVVRGSIQHRGDEHDPPMLVVTSIERAAKQSERRHCSAH